MSSTPIPVSALIAVLQTDSSGTFTSLVDTLKYNKATASAEQVLFIDIDSDDDFMINGESTFSGQFLIEDNDVIATFNKAIDSLDFFTPPRRSDKLTRFLKDMKEDWIAERLLDGYVSFGGNQTLEAYVEKPSTLLSIGKSVIDLKS